MSGSQECAFPRFLTWYVRSLSVQQTTDVFALAQEATLANPRLREPLFLFALFTGRVDELLKAAAATKMYDEWALLSVVDVGRMLREGDEALRYEYRKVWNSYVSVIGEEEREKRVARLRLVRVLEKVAAMVTNGGN